MTPDATPDEGRSLSDEEFERLFERAHEAYGHWASHMTRKDLIRLASGGGWREDVHNTGWSGVYRRIDDGVDRAPLANLLRLNVWCETDQAGRVQLIRACAEEHSPPLDEVLKTAEPLRDVRTIDLPCQPECADAAAVTDAGLLCMTRWPRLQCLAIDELRRTTAAGFAALSGADCTTSLRDARFGGRCDATAVTSFLGRASALRRVDLESDSMTDHAVAHLRACADLVSLTITGGRLTGEGFEAFRRSPTVQQVCLDSPAVDDRGVGLLVDRFPLLRELAVRSGAITDDGLYRLKDLTELRRLDIAGANVTVAGVAALSCLPRLESLALDETPLGDDSVGAIARFRSLRAVSVYGAGITEHGVAALRRSLPRCQVHGP